MLFGKSLSFSTFNKSIYSYKKKIFKRRIARGFGTRVINAFMLVALLAPNITTVAQAAAPLLDDISFGTLFDSFGNPSIEFNESNYQAPQFEHAEPILGERPSDELQALLEENDVEAPPMLFVENVGQFEEAAQFKVQGPQSTIFFAKDAIWVSLLDMASIERARNAEDERFSAENPLEGVHLKLAFSGANRNARIEGFDPINTKVSYLTGKDNNAWKSDVPVWGGLHYKELYPGIDLEVTSEDGQWVWRFVYGDARAPVTYERFTDFGDLSAVDVGLVVEGANELELKEASLRVNTSLGDVRLPLVQVDQLDEFSKLPAQEYTADLQGEELTNPFSMEPNQPQKNDFLLPEPSLEPEASSIGMLASPLLAPLAAPPAVPDDLLYSTFFGSPGGHAVVDIAVTNPNVVYIAIQGGSPNFPITPGAFQEDEPGGIDTVISKFDFTFPGTDALIYSTYLGGSSEDEARGIAVDQDGFAYVAGRTLSNDFPMKNAIDSTFEAADAFVTKLNQDGTDLVYSTYLGGANGEQGLDIAVDAAGAAYVTGQTTSSNFPTKNAHTSYYYGSGWDGFLTKYLPDGSDYAYSTYIGANLNDCEVGGNEYECSVMVNNNGLAYVAGLTDSTVFPVKNAYDAIPNGSRDVFLSVYDTTLSGSASLLYSTYLGGSGVDCDRKCDLAIDNNGMVYIAGATQSSDFPILNEFAGYSGGWDVFLTKIDPTQSGAASLIYSTYLGDVGDDFAMGVEVDFNGEAHVTGYTFSENFPTVFSQADTCSSCPSEPDIFVAKFNAGGDNLVYSTYIGGDDADVARAVAVDTSGAAYIVGETRSDDYPVLGSPPYQDTRQADPAPFITRLGVNLITGVTDETVSNVCSPKSSSCPEDHPHSSLSSSQGKVGDPINTNTGALDYSEIDISIPTSMRTLSFVRAYSSASTAQYTELLGPGWTHNHDLRLIFPSDPGGQTGVVLFKAHTANLFTFIDNQDGTYTSTPGLLSTLVKVSGPPIEYQITDSQQNLYTFDEDGLLLSIEDHEGHAWTYTYAGGLLDSVTDDTGLRFLELEYDAQGRVEGVSDHHGREVSYGYDASGNLVSINDVLGNDWTLAYDLEHRLEMITDPLGHLALDTEYDAQGRAVRQYDGIGNLIVEATYNADGSVTLTDGLSNQSAHGYDGRNTLVGETDASGNTTYQSYDRSFRPQAIRDELGEITQLIWDESGINLTQVLDAAGNQTDLTYDPSNNLTDVIDARGYLTQYDYTGTLLDKTTDALGEETNYTYTPEGFLETITDSRFNTTVYTYDDFGNVESITKADGESTGFVYDDLGRLEETMDANGFVTHNEYDAAGRLIKVTRNYDIARPQNDAGIWNIVTEYGYDKVGNQTQVTDTFGRVTQYQYDAANRLVKTIDPQGSETTNTYDANGNLKTTTDALGRTTTYTYDELNRLVSTTDPLNNTTTTTYNADGTVASTTDALSHTTSYTYDELKRVTAVTDHLGNTTSTEYDEAGNVISTTDAEGRTTTFEYDALGRLILQTDPEGGETEHFYDEVGNRVQTIDPRGNATTFNYDDLNRLETITDALGNVTSYGYDELGNRTSITDGKLNTTQFIYDELNRVIQTIDPLNNTTSTVYDALGNVVSQTNAENETTTFTYDSLNRLETTTDPEGNVTAYTYNAVGNQLTVTDGNNHTTTTTYDDLNRPVTITDAIGNSTTTVYNAVGVVTSTSNGLGNATTFAYDALNRQTSVTDSEGDTTSYTYDDVGNRLTMTDGNGVVTQFEYDDLNRLEAVVENYKPGFTPDHEINVRTEYSYDENGNRLTITDGNSNTSSFTYDALNRLLTEKDPLNHTSTYGFDAVGNRTSLLDANGQTTTYTYDDANQLRYIDYPDTDYDVEFDYDDVGRRTRMQEDLGITTWVYDDLGRPTAITDPFGDTVGYDYDSVGNRTALTYPDGKTVAYQYDAVNRLTQVTDWDSLITSYNYDAANRLSAVTIPSGVISTYSYDDANRLLNINHERNDFITVSDFSYTYDGAGNRLTATESLVLAGAPEPPIPALTFPFSDDMELEDENWLAEGSWQRVFFGLSGTSSWQASLEAPDSDESLTLNGYIPIPSTAERPELQFAETFDAFDDLTLLVEVSTDYAETWNVLSTLTPEDFTEDWLLRRISLQGYQGMPVTIRFRAIATGPNGENAEWSIDDVAFVDRGPSAELGYPFIEDVEAGGNNWIADGEWDITDLDSVSPTHSWAYDPGYELLYGNYSLELDGSITIPGDAVLPQLSFQQKYALDSQVQAFVEVTKDNGASWMILDILGNATISEWQSATYSFSGFEGETIRLRFRTLEGTEYEINSWFLDDIRVEDNPNPIFGLGFPYFGDMEDGGTEWQATGEWVLNEEDSFSPTHSWAWAYDPGQSGEQILTLDGEVTIPSDAIDAGIYLRTKTEISDLTIYVDISEDAGDTWTQVYSRDYSFGPYWLQEAIPLPSYVGQTITVRLRVEGGEPGDSIRVDDLSIQENVLLTDLGSRQVASLPAPRPQFDPAPVVSLVPALQSETVTVTVEDTDGTLQQGLSVYAFDGTTYTGVTGTTDANGQVDLSLDPGDYRFRADLNGVQFFSDSVNHCTIPGCTAATVVVTKPITVTVADTNSAPQQGISVYAFDGTTYMGATGTTDANGEVVFTLQQGDYRFRADLNGTQFWSSDLNHCTLPGCESAAVTLTIPVTVTVEDPGGNPVAGLSVYAYDDTTYTGKTGSTDANGEVVFTLLQGDYRFRADFNGTQFWSDTVNHCTIPGCETATVTVSLPVTVTVTDTSGAPKDGLTVYAYDGSTYTNFSATTNASGEAMFTLPDGDYRFRADLNSTQFWSDDVNHCTVPACTSAAVTVTIPVTVTVLDPGGTPQQDITVYVFDDATYSGFSGVSDANGEAEFTLPQGDYRFRADFNGTQFWSDTANHCSIPGCETASVTITLPLTVTVLDTDATPQEGLSVYAFDGETYTGFSGTTDVNGEIEFTLPDGDYRFRADLNGTQFWSDTVNHCSVPACTSASVTVTRPLTVTVLDTGSTPQEGIFVYVFDEDTYTSFTGTTDVNGEVEFTLPQGDYRFRADFNGTQFWSDDLNHCTLPGCESASVTVTLPMTVTVLDTDSLPQEGLSVYVFDDITYTGFSGTTDVNGEVEFTLPAGDYRFRADFNGTQFWSDDLNHCTIPGCTAAAITVTLPITVTVLDTDTNPGSGLTVYAFDGDTYTGFSAVTDVDGDATFTLPQGSYRFRADFNGTQFWSDEVNDCDLPGCTAASVTISVPVTVTVENTDAVAQEGLTVYVFDGEVYTGYSAVTDQDGDADMTLPLGDYRFRADLNGTQFWSDTVNHCTLPGCGSAYITVTIPVVVTTESENGVPREGLSVYVFDDTTYTGFSGVSDANGQVLFTLPQGDYRFRADVEGVQYWSTDLNHCTIPGCLSATVIVPGLEGEIVNYDIDYLYDALNRLTEANYDNGEFFHYSYDAVGNRLTEDANGVVSTYTYDIANRLTDLNGQSYTWDANGNLLYDGAYEYEYDPANRLFLMNADDNSAIYDYVYNGLGDRLEQNTNIGGVFNQVSYTLDLNAGLTQVLSDGETSYLYGLGRIGEYHLDDEAWMYHHTDALGSVRQLGDANQEIIFSQSYDPYGNILNTVTAGSESNYGYTGEWTDDSDMIHLRARYYAPGMGRFMSRDVWQGDYRKPHSLNKWMYGYGNPISNTDPSGLYTCESGFESRNGFRYWRNCDTQVPYLIAPYYSSPWNQFTKTRLYRTTGAIPIRHDRDISGLFTECEGDRNLEKVKWNASFNTVELNARNILAEMGSVIIHGREWALRDAIGIGYAPYNRRDVNFGNAWSGADNPVKGYLLSGGQLAVTYSDFALGKTFGDPGDEWKLAYEVSLIVAYGIENGYFRDTSFGAHTYYHRPPNKPAWVSRNLGGGLEWRVFGNHSQIQCGQSGPAFFDNRDLSNTTQGRSFENAFTSAELLNNYENGTNPWSDGTADYGVGSGLPGVCQTFEAPPPLPSNPPTREGQYYYNGPNGLRIYNNPPN